MPLISVIVPIYNVTTYLKRCIDSILFQTFTDFELILVDDGSTDISGEICEQYALTDYRINVIHTNNGGVSLARNLGLDFSNGKYICFIDSDDYVLSDYLSVLFSTIEGTNSDAVSQNIYLVKSDVKSVFAHEPYEVNLRNEKERFDFIVNRVLQGKTGWEMWARIFRLDIIRDNHIRVCESCENYAEDLSFFLEYLICCKKCCHIDYAGYCYSQRSDSMVHTSRDNIRLNALNEVAKCFFDYCSTFKYNYFVENFSFLHFGIIKIELGKAFEGKKSLVPVESKKIQQYNWYKKNVIKNIFHYKRIAAICSLNTAFDYCNLLFFSIHRKYKCFF